MGEIFERPASPQALEWTGERLTTETSGQVEIEHLHRYFFARSLCRGRDVLDVASGEGYGAAMLAQVARSVVGVEISEAAVQHAQRSYARDGLRFLTGDARRLPLPDQCVDVVVSFETIEHFFEHDAFMAEVRRVLRPGGLFIVSSPERDVYSPAGGTPNPHHVHELTHAEFQALLRTTFPQVRLYGQRPLLGGALVAEDPAFGTGPILTYERRDARLFEASAGLPRPIYLVALASDAEITASPGSLYVDTSGVEAIFQRAAEAKVREDELTQRLIREGEYAQRVQAELNHRDEQLAAQVAESQMWQSRLAQREEDYAALSAAHASERDASRAAEIVLAKAQVEASERGAVLHREAKAVQSLQAETAAIRALLLEQQQVIVDKLGGPHAAGRATEAVHALKADMVAVHALLVDQKQVIAQALETQTMAAEAAELDRVIVERNDLTGALTEALAQAEVELAAMRSSSSWRLTGPLRGVAERHPRVTSRIQNMVSRHPRARHLALHSVRGTWRLLTLRSPRGRRPQMIRSIVVEQEAPAGLPPPPVAPDVALPAIAVSRQHERTEPGRRFELRPIALAAGTVHAAALPQGQGRRALCVGHVMPFPPRAGNEYRIHRLLRWLAADGWNLTVVLCPQPNEDISEQQIAAAAAVYPNLIVCTHEGVVWHRLADGGRMLNGLQGQTPPDFAALLREDDGGDPGRARMLNLQRSFCPDVLVALLLHLEQTTRPSMLLAEYVFMTRPFALLRPGLTKVVDTIDVFSTKARKVERYGVTDGLAMQEAEEAALLRRADILIGIQADESEDLARLAPSSTVVTVGVDFPVLEDAPPVPGAPVALVVASSNPMNVKGLRDFLRFAWPLVRRELPDAELRVVGAVGDTVEFLPDGVRILGRVEHLDDAYAGARVAINPTVAGTGLKIKTVEALCHLRPVIAWPSGVDGIGPEAMRFCHVATDWFGFATQLVRLLRDDREAGAVASHRDELARSMSADVVYVRLKDALDAR